MTGDSAAFEAHENGSVIESGDFANGAFLGATFGAGSDVDSIEIGDLFV